MDAAQPEINMTTKLRFTHVFAIFLLMGVFDVAQAGNEKNYTYSVITDKGNAESKRTIYVRLPEKITETELQVLSEDLKKTAKKKYERTYIYYLLPGQNVGADAWATFSSVTFFAVKPRKGAMTI